MRVMLVSDIFGITPALTELANQFEGSSIVDPYNGKTMDFENEAAAYSYFINTIGLDNYLVHLSEVVKSIETDTALVDLVLALQQYGACRRMNLINL